MVVLNLLTLAMERNYVTKLVIYNVRSPLFVLIFAVNKLNKSVCAMKNKGRKLTPFNYCKYILIFFEDKYILILGRDRRDTFYVRTVFLSRMTLGTFEQIVYDYMMETLYSLRPKISVRILY